MKITHIEAENFLGLRRASIDVRTPVVLFAGANFAGKSSLQEAVRMALTGETVRVDKKKDYGSLVSDGEKSGFVEVSLDKGGTEGSVTVVLPKGNTSTVSYSVPHALTYLLDAQRFASLDGKARRAFLFGLMGVKTDMASVTAKLLERGLAKAKIDRVVPLLRGGFDGASAEAKAKATEAKGAWRALTGETYGSEKAKTWRAPVPAFDAAAAATLATELKHCDTALESWQKEIGKLQAELDRREVLRKKLPGLAEAADRIVRARVKLGVDEAELHRITEEIARAEAAAGTGPRKGLVHELAAGLAWAISFAPADVSPQYEDADKALGLYEAAHGKLDAAASGDPEALTRLAALKPALATCTSAVANDRRDIDAAIHAAAEADTIKADLTAEFDDKALAAAQQQADELKRTRIALVAKADAHKAAKAQADAADKKTKDAAVHHVDVMQWDAIGDALAPDGIPGELLAAALEPINARLAQSAADAEWLHISIGADMTIACGARPYAMLSESERWRVDAMIAEAVSHLSGLRLLVLDRFDVLDQRGRGDLLAWLDILASNGEIDSALIFGTLKQLPTQLPPTVSAVWIEAGVAQQAARLAEAA